MTGRACAATTARRRVAWAGTPRAALTAAVLGATVACGPDGPVPAPAVRTMDAVVRGGLVFVPAVVDDRDLLCLLDTGANVVLAKASVLDAQPGDAVPTGTFTVAGIDYDELTIFALDDDAFDALGDDDLAPDCVLGNDVLDDVATTIDYAGARVQMVLPTETPTLSIERVGAAAVVDLQAQPSYWLTTAVLGGAPVQVAVDTGAQLTTLTSDAFARLAAPPATSPATSESPDGSVDGAIGRDLDVEMGPVATASAAFGVFDLPAFDGIAQIVGAPVEGLVGAAVLVRYAPTFDGPARTLTLRPYDADVADAHVADLLASLGL